MPKRKNTVWKGPEEDGITFSLLSQFLVCRERFRLLVVEGLKPMDQWQHRLEFGTMWHLCEEEYAETKELQGKKIRKYATQLLAKYPNNREDISKYYNIIMRQFPIYMDYWKNHKYATSRTPLMQEVSFKVPYTLPSGRVVLLRGKWDSTDLIGVGRKSGIYLQENKTKGDIKQNEIKKQLSFDLQTMIYLVALQEAKGLEEWSYESEAWYTARRRPIKGILYNVIRRPLSGGKHSIRKKKPTKSNPQGQTDEEFYAELADRIDGDRDFFFARWKVEITQEDIDKFKRECLDPLLEHLCLWWKMVTNPKGLSAGQGMHWRTPFGVWDVLKEGRMHDLDEYLATGSELGLQHTNDLFPELD